MLTTTLFFPLMPSSPRRPYRVTYEIIPGDAGVYRDSNGTGYPPTGDDVQVYCVTCKGCGRIVQVDDERREWIEGELLKELQNA